MKELSIFVLRGLNFCPYFMCFEKFSYTFYAEYKILEPLSGMHSRGGLVCY